MAAVNTYTNRYCHITASYEQMDRFVDGRILWDNTLEENFDCVCRYHKHCARKGITINGDKFCFGRKEVEYLRFLLTEDSMKPWQDMLRSIAEFPEPKDLTGVRSWHGLLDQVGSFHTDPGAAQEHPQIYRKV